MRKFSAIILTFVIVFTPVIFVSADSSIAQGGLDDELIEFLKTYEISEIPIPYSISFTKGEN